MQKSFQVNTTSHPSVRTFKSSVYFSYRLTTVPFRALDCLQQSSTGSSPSLQTDSGHRAQTDSAPETSLQAQAARQYDQRYISSSFTTKVGDLVLLYDLFRFFLFPSFFPSFCGILHFILLCHLQLIHS